jgi:hypothetical protein
LDRALGEWEVSTLRDSGLTELEVAAISHVGMGYDEIQELIRRNAHAG